MAEIIPRPVIPALPRYPRLAGIRVVSHHKHLVPDRDTPCNHISRHDFWLWAGRIGVAGTFYEFRKLTDMKGLSSRIDICFSAIFALSDRLFPVVKGNRDIAVVRDAKKFMVVGINKPDVLALGVVWVFVHRKSVPFSVP